jgi:hypothetical protein
MPEQVAHFAPYPDPIAKYRGMSWLSPVIEEIVADSSATSHKRNFFDSGAKLGYVVTMDGDMAPQKFDEWVKRFKQGHEGALNAYKTLFLAGGADVKVVGADMKQVDFKAIQGAGETRICAAARVPPIIAGVSEGLQSATYSNYGQARRAFADLTMRPMWRNMVGSFARLVPVPAAAELWYDDRDIPFLQEDQSDRAAIQKTDAETIHTLVIAGFEPDTAVKAVMSGDYGLLQHSGMYSVQLTPPGAVSEGKGALVGGAVVPRRTARRRPQQHRSSPAFPKGQSVARPYSLSEGYMSDQTPPRENLIRAVMPGLEFRDATEGDPLPDGVIGILRVLFSPVGEWTEINSAWEGNFLERFAEGAWKKTIRESAAKVRSLFQHGMDPQVGDKPLGPIRMLEEGDRRRLRRGRAARHLLQPGSAPGPEGGPVRGVASLRGDARGVGRQPGAFRGEPEGSAGAHDQGGAARGVRAGHLPRLSGRDRRRSFAHGRVPGAIRAIRCDPVKAREMFDRAISLQDLRPRQGDLILLSEQDEPTISRTSRKTHPPAPTPPRRAPRRRSAA